MVFRENGRPVGHAGQRAQQRHAVVQRLPGTGLVQVHRELVVEREQLQLVHGQPEEVAASRTDRGDLRQLFQTQDLTAVHLFLRGKTTVSE